MSHLGVPVKGVILAAGYGSRFLPVTKTVPKEMLPLVNKPSIDFILEEFEESGFGIEEIYSDIAGTELSNESPEMAIIAKKK